jgi:hypothetical protein
MVLLERERALLSRIYSRQEGSHAGDGGSIEENAGVFATWNYAVSFSGRLREDRRKRPLMASSLERRGEYRASRRAHAE